MNKLQLLKLHNEGVTIHSSGTTGIPKTIFRTAENVQNCCSVAVSAQKITPESRILTVTRMTHAGGLLAQSLPAVMVGAHVEIKSFNAFNFLDEFSDFTHTFLTPGMMAAISQTKKFKTCSLVGKRILTGSDPVDWEIMSLYLQRGAIVQPNWGMSEIGPITIYSTLHNLDDLQRLRALAPPGSYLLGDHVETDCKIVDGELYVRGPLCVYEGWFATGDLVDENSGVFFYKGRK